MTERTVAYDLLPGDRVYFGDELWTVVWVDRFNLDLVDRCSGRVQKIRGLWEHYRFLRAVEDQEGIPL